MAVTTPRLLRRLDRLRRRVLVHRRPLAALAVGLAVWLGLQAAAGPPAPTEPVWTLARDLQGGDVLNRADLRRVGYLAGTVPDGAVADPRELIGRPLAHAAERGQPVSESLVLGERWLADHEGESVVPVRVSDPAVVSLLRVGDRVDLLGTAVSATDASAVAEVLAEAARIVAVPKVAPDAGSTPVPGRLVLVAVTPERVQKVTSAAASQFLSVTWSH